MKRLKVPGRPYQAPSVDELYHSETRTTRSPASYLTHGWWEKAAREKSARCAGKALFVIPRTAQRRCTKTVRGKFVDDMKNGRVKSRFVAAGVARDVRYDVRAGTLAL